MSFASSGSRPSDKTIQDSELSNIIIKKPRTLSKTCPVETTTQRLPLIRDKPRSKKEVGKSKESSSSADEYWLKPGISLPKLKPQEVPQPVSAQKEEINESLKSTEFNSVIGLKGVSGDFDEFHQQALSKSLNCYKNVQGTENESSDVVGPSECQNVFRVPSSELDLDQFKVEVEDLEESHALRRWEYWLKEHKHVQQYLCNRLKRNESELQFLKAQNYRMMVEDRSLFLFAQVPVADKWRGHPFRWKPALKIGGPKTELLSDEFIPEYYGTKTKLEMGEVPDLEFIGTPEVIKKEKNLIFKNAEATFGWENLPYRQNRLRDLRKITKKLKPHNVQMDKLEVVGTQISPPKKAEVVMQVTPNNLPTIKVTEFTNEDFCSKDVYAERSSVFWLTIGNEELQYEIGNENCQTFRKTNFNLKWEIDFGEHPAGVLVERTLRVENKGTMAVEYNFFLQKKKTTPAFNSLQPRQHEPWFFFNKNSGIFLPGQIYDLKFYKYAKAPGVRKEIWHLATKPPLIKNSEESGTIVLWAVTTDDFSDSDINALDSYFRKRVSLSIVNFILQIIYKKIMNPSENLLGIEYRSLFHEKELFEYQNPKHFYHSGIVKKFHKCFEQIPNKKQEEWDLSLASLIELIKIYVQPEDQDSLFCQIAESAKRLLKPNYLLIKNLKKYQMAYEILCKLTSFMEDDYDYLRNCLTDRREEVKKVTSEFGETDEEYNGLSMISVEKEAAGEEKETVEVLLEIKPINFLFFQHMFYLKVYQRVCEAVEQIVGALETAKLLEPWKTIDVNLSRPFGTDNK